VSRPERGSTFGAGIRELRETMLCGVSSPAASFGVSGLRFAARVGNDGLIPVSLPTRPPLTQAGAQRMRLLFDGRDSVTSRLVLDYRVLRRGDRVVLLSNYTGGNVRSSADAWASGPDGAHRFDECYLYVVNEPYYLDANPFWPNEPPNEPSRYPHRIGIDPVPIGSISLTPGVDLSAHVLSEVRRSHILSAQGYLVDALGPPAIGHGTSAAPSGSTPGDQVSPDQASAAGQDYAIDPLRRRYTEDYAMKLATTRYANDGWEVKNVSRRNDETEGTPYDLRCTQNGEVRHVEVEGTTGSGDTVLLSANERKHAADSHKPGESYLFVVEQIDLKTSAGQLKAVGGVVRYDGPLLVEDERLPLRSAVTRCLQPSTHRREPLNQGA
jgi:Domain of unknown function (DUF3883)